MIQRNYLKYKLAITDCHFSFGNRILCSGIPTAVVVHYKHKITSFHLSLILHFGRDKRKGLLLECCQAIKIWISPISGFFLCDVNQRVSPTLVRDSLDEVTLYSFAISKISK